MTAYTYNKRDGLMIRKRFTCARCGSRAVRQTHVERIGWLCNPCYDQLQEVRRKVREFESEEFRKFKLGPKGKP